MHSMISFSTLIAGRKINTMGQLEKHNKNDYKEETFKLHCV